MIVSIIQSINFHNHFGFIANAWQSAQDFAECINKLTDDEQDKISKEMIKKMFSIEIESDLAQSLFVRKTQRPFVSQEIAEMFECPEVKFYDHYVSCDCDH